MRTESLFCLLVGFLIGAAAGAVAISVLHSPHPKAVATLAVADPVPLTTKNPPDEIPDTPTAAATQAPAHRPSGHIYFSGKMKSQGAIEIYPEDHYTLSQAIAVQGGLAQDADQRRIRILHVGTLSGSAPQTFDFAAILDHGAKDPVLAPGDIVFVPQRLINF